MNSFDFVTVVFNEELPILKVQAQSIEKYCAKLRIGKIFVVLNDDNIDIDPAWYGSLSDCVEILHRDQFDTFTCTGWVSQQILKMYAASYGTSKWSIVLDAKTIFVNQIDPELLFDPRGRIRVGDIPIYPVFYPSKKIVDELFDISIDSVIGPSGVPFFFHNDTVREMIATVETITKKTFSKYFQEKGMITEFMLYSGYVKYRDTSFDQLYSGYFNYQVVNVCHSEVARFDEKFNTMHNSNVLTVSIHRNAWKQLSTAQQHQYLDLLSSKNLKIGNI